MVNKIISNYLSIQDNLKPNVKLIAVSKTFDLNEIRPLIDHGHLHFGENKFQEASSKWAEVIRNNKQLNLHMIGKLQSNKAKKAVDLFNYIHSLDNEKLSDVLSKAEKEKNKKLNYFIQVNIGDEDQKSGINSKNLSSFFRYCTKENKLNVIGLMAIPPLGKNTFYFERMKELNDSLNLKELSMGMSSDYQEAIKNGATFIRLGTSIFGSRD
ncbi:MAG: YggS family pyridoxal phosphate-dependent enzyme [Candidatus Pelagibacter sp.]|nr:YggS family pyridoxal phosphate-dependent enzyme [Candidatus Pelagibacter sp.]OUW23603.1 MAG: YggS family pyridoxal phosphate enzyme [Rickettsiales bacterium TMED174]|tara:strand:+ start:149 stop:784 length:636 start_codon:yes stop_codon:yes gene_type:complete